MISLYSEKDRSPAFNTIRRSRLFLSLLTRGFIAYCALQSLPLHAEGKVIPQHGVEESQPQSSSQKKILENQEKLKEDFHAPEESDETMSHTELPSFESLMVKTILMLGFMISSLVAGAWFLRKLHGPTLQKSGSSESSIEILERKNLSAKSVIWYARIHGVPHVIVESQHGVAISHLPCKSLNSVDTKESSDPLT